MHLELRQSDTVQQRLTEVLTCGSAIDVLDSI